MTGADRTYMDRALELARLGLGRTAPNPAVGAVLVREGRIVGEGHHARAGEAHAEVAAIEAAGAEAAGATLYVNLEPCCVHGKTPPCTERIIEAGISRVAAAMPDPNPAMDGKGFAALRAAGIEVESGLLREEAERLNEAFSIYMREGRPFVTVKAAVSLDGKVAARTGEARWVSGEESRRRAHLLRAKSDAVLIGIRTAMEDDPLLDVRLEGEERRPLRVVLDGKARLPVDSRLAGTAKEMPVLVLCGPDVPALRVLALQRLGVQVERVADDLEGLRVDQVLKSLAGRGVLSLLVEGGPAVNASFLRAGLVDKLILFVAPKALGSEAPALFGRLPVDAPDEAPRFRFEASEAVGEDMMLTLYSEKESR